MSASANQTRPTVLFVAIQTGAEANGGITSLGELISRLTEHVPVVLTNRESPVVARWRARGIEVHVVSESASKGVFNAPIASAVTYFRYFRVISRLLANTAARIVHANDPLAFQLAYAAVRTRSSVRLVLNIRDTIGPDRAPPRKRYRRLFGAADHILFLSRDMIARWAEIVPGIESKSSATFSIVDPGRFTPQPLSSATPKVALVSGLVCTKKGQLEFLRNVAPLLAAKGIETWMVGDFDPTSDGYAAACRAAAAPLGPMARFLGYQSDVEQLYARAHVVCVSSRYEGLMRTMLEAMAAGRPVVSTDVASAREMLLQPGHEAGAVFPIGCGPAMADEIVRLCNDETANKRMGSNGSAIARRTFKADRVVAAYEGVYAALVSGPAANP